VAARFKANANKLARLECHSPQKKSCHSPQIGGWWGVAAHSTANANKLASCECRSPQLGKGVLVCNVIL